MEDPDVGRPLGPWGKLYADIVERKAHYTDRQFRRLIEVIALAIRGRGELPPAKALRARLGPREFDFLVSEGDLSIEYDVVTLHKWPTYQAKVDRTNTERQARYRERRNALSNGVSHGLLPTSTSSNVTEDPLTGETPPAREGSPMTVAIGYIGDRTRRDFQYRPGSKVWDTLEADLRDFGPVDWQKAAEQVERQRGEDVGQVVFGATKILHPINGNGTKARGEFVRPSEEVDHAFER
jgi:hypothetical protein